MRLDKHKPVINLLASEDRDYFLDCVDELYTTIRKDTTFEVQHKISKHGRLKSWLIRKLTNMPFLFKLPTRIGNSNEINFASMISGDFRLMLPFSLMSRRNYIYMYDVWPRFHRWIFPLLDFFNITYVFFSSKQVYEAYQAKYAANRCKAMWLPEALNIEEYHFVPKAQKHIDVLEFGRNYQAYHDLIRPVLASHRKKHIFKRSDVPVLFKGKAAFTAALAESKIVICVPSDISHPERAEYISTMTLRYLQAMASKCLIVGMLPSDMVAAFGYLPIIEIDMDRAGEQIIDILNHYDDYLPLIEKNYAEVKANHQWQNRWELIKSKMGGEL